MRSFDQKFGGDLIKNLPPEPGVYLFRDVANTVLYVGKAKNLRRRLANYRNASRRKAHRKMRAIVRASSALEVRLVPTERRALEVENTLIQRLMPRFNVMGKFSFLYPAIGWSFTRRRALLCFTTQVDHWSDHQLRWFGAFRSRLRAREAFDALVDLLGLLGHLERVPGARIRGSRIVGIRQVPRDIGAGVESLLSGASNRGLRTLAAALVEKPRARHESADVQNLLHRVDDFFDRELVPLRQALRQDDRSGTFVPQDERDLLFIRTG